MSLKRIEKISDLAVNSFYKCKIISLCRNKENKVVSIIKCVGRDSTEAARVIDIKVLSYKLNKGEKLEKWVSFDDYYIFQINLNKKSSVTYNLYKLSKDQYPEYFL